MFANKFSPANISACEEPPISLLLICHTKKITNKMKKLTNGPVDKSPSISKDGNMIMYTKTLSSGKTILAMVSMNGRIKTLFSSRMSGNILSPKES
jgi:Tol biopolymer transport system component